MENYTKYKLKSKEELASVLEGKDNLFVIACNKCFKEFETVDEPDCDEFLAFAAEQGKKYRLREAARLGFTTAVVPTLRREIAIPGLSIVQVDTLQDALGAMLQ